MTKLEQYRQQIQKLLQDYADFDNNDPDVETQTIFDTDRNHYQLVQVGWQNGRRVYGCILHLDIKNDKVWLQHNGTENSIAAELVALGIPKSDIVIGFHSPFKRQFTDYATS